ncbi:MAG: transporter permease [Frankiales bacterium]|jgi:ABC-2 type transport system permease protein|nr:transporter permease [Frankiales bacterium]
MTAVAEAPTQSRPGRPPVPALKVTQARVFTSEWIKMRSLRSTGFTLLAAVVAMIALGCLVGWATNAHWAQMDPGEHAHFEAIGRSLAGVNLAQLAIGVLGVLLVSGEYATGMIRATFSAAPRRLPVVWAKAALFAAVTFVLMLISSFLAFFGGQYFLAAHGTTLSAPHALRAVFGVAVYLTLVGVFAVALGFIVRSTAGGIATLFGLLLVLPGIGQVLPASWQQHTLPYLPSNAGASLFGVRLDPTALSPGAGLAVLCLWVVAGLALAAVLVKRRDA